MAFGWHPREHRAALDGMLMLTLEERGAYNTVLDLIYDRVGPIPDDARWLAGWMGVSLKRWATIRASLIEKGKIFAISVNGQGCLMNERAAKELENQAKLQRNSRVNGAKGGRKPRETDTNINENNAEPEPTGNPTLKLLTKTQTIGSEAKASAGKPAELSPNAKAWVSGAALLVSQGGMTLEAAKAFFGKLLAQYGLEGSDLLGAIGEAEHNQTRDPQGWLTKAAQARGKRRQTGPPKRVGFV